MKYNLGAPSTWGHATIGDKSVSLQIVMQAGLILLQAARTMPHQQLTKTCVSAWLNPTLGLWKCNQTLIVGFGDNDYTIRELMRFIKMTSNEFMFEDATRNEEHPIKNIDGFKLKEDLNSFIFWILV